LVVMPEGHLRSRLMELLALGLEIAEESEDETELPHLASALEVSLRVVHFAVFVCNTVEDYRHGCMLQDLIAERGRVRPGGRRKRSLLESIMCYVTLNDEPKLAWRSLQLMQLTCQKRDQDVFQVLASDTSEARREHIITSFAEWLQSADDNYDVTTSIFDLLIDSLARVDDEHSTAHYLLGFTPYQPAMSELGKDCPMTRLIKALYQRCDDHDVRWIADCQLLYEKKIRIVMEELDEDEGASDGGPDERQLMLSQMAQNEHCMEIFYRLVAHSGTREATLRLLLDPHVYVSWGSGGVPAGREGSVGKLLAMMHALPIEFAQRCGQDLKEQRNIIKTGWAGEGLPEEPEGLREEARKCWNGGQRDLTTEMAMKAWEAQEEWEACMKWRCDLDDLEDKLDAAQECLLNFFHQSGWFLRTMAVLFFATREQLSGCSSANTTDDGRHIAFSLEHAKVGSMSCGVESGCACACACAWICVHA